MGSKNMPQNDLRLSFSPDGFLNINPSDKLIFQNNCGPYLTKLALTPVGGISETEIADIFSNPEMKKIIASYSSYGNNSSNAIIHNNSLSFYFPSTDSAVGNLSVHNLTLAGSNNHFTVSNFPTTSSFDTSKYFSIKLNPQNNSSLSTTINSIVFKTYKSDTGPKKLSVEFLLNGISLPDPDNSLCILLNPSKKNNGFGIVPPYGLINETDGIEIRLYATNATNSSGTFGFNSNSEHDDCLTIFGEILGTRDFNIDLFDERATISPKAIHSESWDSPTGMYVAKELYKYDFNTNQRIELVDTGEENNCSCKIYDKILSFDFCKNEGYELAVLPMAWDPEFQKYVLSSLTLSLSTNWQYDEFDGTTVISSNIFTRNFNPEIYDNKSTETSANFSVRKTDCFTTSGYNEYDGESGIEEYVSANFSYYISADFCGIHVFTSPQINPLNYSPILNVTPDNRLFETLVDETQQKTFRIIGQNINGNIDVFLSDDNNKFNIIPTSFIPTNGNYSGRLSVTFSSSEVGTYDGKITFRSKNAQAKSVSLQGSASSVEPPPPPLPPTLELYPSSEIHFEIPAGSGTQTEQRRLIGTNLTEKITYTTENVNGTTDVFDADLDEWTPDSDGSLNKEFDVMFAPGSTYGEFTGNIVFSTTGAEAVMLNLSGVSTYDTGSCLEEGNWYKEIFPHFPKQTITDLSPNGVIPACSADVTYSVKVQMQWDGQSGFEVSLIDKITGGSIASWNSTATKQCVCPKGHECEFQLQIPGNEYNEFDCWWRKS